MVLTVNWDKWNAVTCLLRTDVAFDSHVAVRENKKAEKIE
jgi:hypothetical protein